MRPQHITAENTGRAKVYQAHLPASMRPQHITAENCHGAQPAGHGAGSLQ